MTLRFCLNIDERGIRFFTLPPQKNIEILDYKIVDPLYRLFGYTDIDNIPFYRNLLSEIARVENGNNEVFEDSYDVGGGLSLELKITKDVTYCETWTDVRQCLELPTSEFKKLVANWIKFVEVNTAAFYSK
ncbi:hypothetical protein V3Q90_15410 [Flavobacterium oreochromis]|uniref:hypothetical protein n=1 Tax=Flavobacterium oreochromis TaxID=2906078 RepID=UPI00385CB688